MKIKGLARDKKYKKRSKNVVKHGRSMITTQLNMNVCKLCYNGIIHGSGAFCTCKIGKRERRRRHVRK